jgi:hypothetical protein
MSKNNVRKISGTIIVAMTAISSVYGVVPVVHADTNLYQDRFDANLLTKTINSFVKPQNLIITPLKFKYETQNKFAQSIFYYFVDRLGFPQSPVEYTIDRAGNFSRLINIDEDFTKDIVVGIDDTNSGITEQQLDAIFKLIDRYDIPKENIQIKNIKLASDKKNLEFEDIKDSPLQSAVQSLAARPKTKKTLKIENVEATYPQSVDPSTNVDVTVKFKNSSGLTLYKDDANKIVIRTMNNKDSELFVNGKWFSKSKTGEMQESRIKDGESGTMKFTIMTPLAKGSFTEGFEFTNNSNDKISETFRIVAIVKDNGQKILQILDTGYGYLNVRQEARYGSSIVGTVNTGEKYLYTEEQNGYYKIRIVSKNIEGWVPGQFSRKL